MTTKQRVYDLAKEFGMTGQELAAKLRDLGFTAVKSHMTALSDFEILEIRGRLEAYGIVGESAGDGPDALGGLKIKRRKRKAAEGEEEVPPAAGAAVAPAAPAAPAVPTAPPPVAVPAAAAAPPAAPPLGVEELAERGAAAEGPAPPPGAGIETVRPAPAAPAPPPEAVPAEVRRALAPAAMAPAAAEAPVRPAEDAFAAAPPEGAEIGAAVAEEILPPPAPLLAEEAREEGAEVPGEEIALGEVEGEEEDGTKVVRPSVLRRTGKVVGFIDPAQFQQPAPRRAQSRRLRSTDDLVPDVQPTFGRDRRPGQVRGDQTRGTLTAQELRDRESGRFLRRRRAAGSAEATRKGPRTMRTKAAPGASPYAGASVAIDAPITIKKLANTLAVKENQVLQVAVQQIGFGININSLIDEDAAMLLADEFDVELEVVEEVEAEESLLKSLSDKREAVAVEDLVDRPPTVAFLGHVDHGKTTLIDTIRQSRIVQGESGGITQHIGAYQVQSQRGHTITIIDTPGHAAFTAMRARGVEAVDVVVLVVAADDGVQPQTEEALNHARAAKVPIVVALNKIDKPEAAPERVMNQLAALGLTPELWGGETAMLHVSGLRGDGIEDLLERVVLESEVLERKCHPEGPAQGIVLEAEIEQGKGKVAHLLVKDGSLNRGDVILAGEGYGKVRSIHDDRGRQIDAAGPSMPVEVTGLNELPTVGDAFHVVESLDEARAVAMERAHKHRLLTQIEQRPILHTDIQEAVEEQEKTTINLIVKADVQGSVEVLKQQIASLQHEEMKVRLLHAGVGSVLESDVDLAATSSARILAFHTSATNKVRQQAEHLGVDIKVYRVIYELLDDIRRLMEGELAPEIKEEVLGHAEIRRVFKSSKLGNIAGCFVLDGKVTRSSRARLLRDGQVVYEGAIASLRREADDAKEVREGFECGLLLKDYNDLRPSDVIEAFRMIEVRRTL
ncbi:MAG: translation initiation factor IF-2 [Planctomycetota bacterium]